MRPCLICLFASSALCQTGMGPFQHLLNEEVPLHGISQLGVEASVE